MEQIIPYCGPAPLPETLATAWTFAPLPVALALAPLAGVALKRLAGGGPRPAGPGPETDAPARRDLIPAGLASLGLALAFLSPLCALTVALFSARTAHHLVLLFLVAPALAALRPLAWPRGAGLAATSALLWLWHLPAAYAWAWESPSAYWLMQAGMVGAAWAMWSDLRAEDPVGGLVQILALTGEMGLIGAILTFAPGLLYPQHLATTAAFGLDALDDQRLAGLVMWGPGMLPLALAGAWMARQGWRRMAAP